MATVTPCCPTVFKTTLPKKEAEALAALFKALSDPVRLRVLSFIAAQTDGEACVCHVTEPAGVSQPTASHHLKVLHDAGLLEREKRGVWVYYRVVPERLEEARTALALRPRRTLAAKRV